MDRQEEDCRALAKRHGYEVVTTYRENDVSASTRSRKPRPQFAEMLSGARAGEFDAILAYSNSRLTRRPLEVEDIISLHERYGTRFETVVSGNDDLSTADGRMVARIKGNVDAAEAERTAERVARAKARAALEGRYRGGRRPYGYRKDGMTVREAEAKVIRDATRDVLAGRSLSVIARELNKQGVKTSTGKPWTPMQLRDMLTRPRNAGLIARGQVGRSRGEGRAYDFEIVGKAQWPAIVDEDTWRALYAMLTEPSRRTQTGSKTTWLGSGIYRCGGFVTEPVLDEHGEPVLDERGKKLHRNVLDAHGEPIVCGAILRAAAFGGTSARPNHKRKVHYRCTRAAHLMVLQEPTDAFVLGYVSDKVRHPEVIAALSPKAPDMSVDRERHTLLERRLAQVERDFDDDLIDARRYAAKRDKTNAEIAEIDARIATAIQRSSASPIAGAADPSKAFLEAAIDIQRAVLSTVLRVEIVPATRRGAAWTSDRLRLTMLVGSEADAA